ncbi:MAG: hypothetical protein AAB502_01230 [Chloroflexota bacterium]
MGRKDAPWHEPKKQKKDAKKELSTRLPPIPPVEPEVIRSKGKKPKEEEE